MATDISARANRSGSWTSLWRGALMALATADHDGGFVTVETFCYTLRVDR